MLAIDTYWNHIRLARMIKQSAHVAIEIGVNTKLHDQNEKKNRWRLIENARSIEKSGKIGDDIYACSQFEEVSVISWIRKKR